MPDPMNMLYFLTDQHRRDTLGCYGNRAGTTPVLDRMAACGIRFDNWFTPTAICTPARASFLTGSAPFRHKLLANRERNVAYSEDLGDDQFTFSLALREAGYNCGLIGKWHTGRKSPAEFGFEGPHLGGWHNPVDHPDYRAYLNERGLAGFTISDEIRGTFPNGAPGNLLAARLQQPVEATFEYYLATRAIETLQRYADRLESQSAPFFLSVNFFGPHLPYLLPDHYFDLYDPAIIDLPESIAETFCGKPAVQKNYSAHWGFDTIPIETSRKLIAAYWGYVTLIDEQIGRILTELERLGLAGTTATFFSSDHGEFTGSHRLHDKGPAMYDDIYRTAGLIHVPGAPEGVVSDELVSLMDSTATILELAGLDPSPAVDSRSLMSLILDEHPSWDKEIVCEFHGHHFPYPQRMIRTHTHKLVVNPESVNELYDLEQDPSELHNVYDHPEMAPVRRSLMGRLYSLLRDRGDNFFHWMTSMYEIGDVDHDPALSPFGESQRTEQVDGA